MERRQFIIGAGAILTTAFVSKAEWFLEHEKRVVPLVEETPSEQVLYFVNTGFDYELRLDEPEVVLPEMTLREALEAYHGVDVPNRPLRLSEWRELYYEHGVLPTALDQPADWDWVIEVGHGRTAPMQEPIGSSKGWTFLKVTPVGNTWRAAFYRRMPPGK